MVSLNPKLSNTLFLISHFGLTEENEENEENENAFSHNKSNFKNYFRPTYHLKGTPEIFVCSYHKIKLQSATLLASNKMTVIT